MTQRTHTDGKPFYCIVCGLGWNEYQACEEVVCELETEAAAKARGDVEQAARRETNDQAT